MNERSRPDYGVDAPGALIGLIVGGSVLAVAAALGALAGGLWWLLPAVPAALMLFGAASYAYTTRYGKFEVWQELLAQLRLSGGQRIVDLGCGRGAVLLAAARQNPGGWSIGVDLWRTADQSGNQPAAARRNAAAAGVRVDLVTADLRALPIASASTDVVLSSMAIHHIPGERDRRVAIAEAARILRPGGRLIIVDFRHTHAYGAELALQGLRQVRVRRLGWRFWYGGPWGGASVLTATR